MHGKPHQTFTRGKQLAKTMLAKLEKNQKISKSSEKFKNFQKIRQIPKKTPKISNEFNYFITPRRHLLYSIKHFTNKFLFIFRIYNTNAL